MSPVRRLGTALLAAMAVLLGVMGCGIPAIAYTSSQQDGADQATVVTRMNLKPDQVGCGSDVGDSTVTHHLVGVGDAWLIRDWSVDCHPA